MRPIKTTEMRPGRRIAGYSWIGPFMALSLALAALAACDQSSVQRVAPLANGATFRDCPNCPEMVVVPAGSFSMGSPDGETGRREYESPLHAVSISRFAVGRYEITFDEWDACVAAGACPNRDAPPPSKSTGLDILDRIIQRSDLAAGDDAGWGRGRQPAISISWDDAKRYTVWLSAQSGHAYRLLSESEWEYAARAGSAGAYWWGDAASRDNANYGPNDLNGEVVNAGKDQWTNTAPVGSFPSSPFGLFDMNGNAREWTEDCFAESYVNAPSNGAAVTLDNCEEHVTRGGAFNNPPESIRSAARIGAKHDYRLHLFGFRVARTL